MQLIDPSHAFYKPLWIRLLIVGSCTFWAILEAIKGDPFFIVIMGALAIYSARVLLLNYKLPENQSGAKSSSEAIAENTEKAAVPADHSTK